MFFSWKNIVSCFFKKRIFFRMNKYIFVSGLLLQQRFNKPFCVEMNAGCLHVYGVCDDCDFHFLIYWWRKLALHEWKIYFLFSQTGL